MKHDDFRIFVDLDGVVADWLGKAMTTFGINLNNPAMVDILSTDIRGLEKIIDTKHMWRVIDEGGAGWWEEIEPLPWAMYLYESVAGVLCGGKEHVCFLTQPSDDGGSWAGKHNWIRRYFGKVPTLLGEAKHFCAGRYSILIDDTPKKINAFTEAGGNAVLFPNQWTLKANCEPDDYDGWKLAGYNAVDDVVRSITKIMTNVRNMDRKMDAAGYAA